MQAQENTFFTKDVYNTEIHLEVNDDVLQRIYEDHVKPTDRLPIEFVFITDVQINAEKLKNNLLLSYPTYTSIVVLETEDFWEVHGISNPILMNVNEINNWNQVMWDFGYQFDCQLDGWQVGVE